MADYLRLFMAKRLTAKEPHHLEYIKGRLANMKIEDPKAYGEYSEYYGVEIEAKVTKEPTSSTTVKSTKDDKTVTKTVKKALSIKS